ncbi:MAG: DUF1592 domain-containing protein [Rubripirellula sp.]
MSFRPLLLLVLIGALASSSRAEDSLGSERSTELNLAFTPEVQNLLQKHCIACHGEGEEVHGDVNFLEMKTASDVDDHYELWETAVELVGDDAMPPEDQARLTSVEKLQLQNWYQERFVQSVEAHPGNLRPRRLSANEYRNTLRSLFGFDLEVAIIEAEQTIAETSLIMKLLPIDPPGPSGFKNDTSANPLTTNVWDQYAYLTDAALERLFEERDRVALEAYSGPIESRYLTVSQAESVLRKMAAKIYRRPPQQASMRRSLESLQGKKGQALEDALRGELKAILMSPAFMYRGLLVERGDETPEGFQAVDDYELAERLSYFLWADMPDARLLQLAERGSLRDSDVYAVEIDRMLASEKASNLATDFAVQWFSLDEIDKVSDNPPVAHALKQQPLDFVQYLFAEGRPLMELIDSEITFANHHTAKFYPGDRKRLTAFKKQKGIEVEAVPNQRLELQQTVERGGLLTMPGVLAMNRGPVLRGTWILERVLGQHLPDPPANVGQVPSNKRGESLTFRERFELHRSNTTCAVCHDKIDPLGFAMQAYDDAGGYVRSKQYASMRKKKKQQEGSGDAMVIDTSGRLPSGEQFEDFEGLKQILVTSKRKQVIRTIVQRTLSYALCRKLEIHDVPTVDAIVDELDGQSGTFHDLVHSIANSLPFTQTVIRSH